MEIIFMVNKVLNAPKECEMNFDAGWEIPVINNAIRNVENAYIGKDIEEMVISIAQFMEIFSRFERHLVRHPHNEDIKEIKATLDAWLKKIGEMYIDLNPFWICRILP